MITDSGLHDLLTLFALVVSGASLLFSIFLFFKLRSLLAKIAIIQTQLFRKSAASQLRNSFSTVNQLFWQLPEPTVASPVNTVRSQGTGVIAQPDVNVYMLLGLMVLAVVCVFFIARRLFGGRQKIGLSLLVFVEDKYVILDLLNLDLPLKSVDFEGYDIISRLRTSLYNCVPCISIDWNEIALRINNITIFLPDHFRIGLCDYHKLRLMVARKYCSLLLLKYGDCIIGYVGNKPDDVKLPVIEVSRGIFYTALNKFSNTIKTSLTERACSSRVSGRSIKSA